MYAIELNRLDVLIVSGSYVNRNGWIHNGRKLNHNLFVFIEEGQCTMHINGKIYSLQKNDFIIIPQNTFYQPHTENYCKHWFGHFYGHFLGSADSPEICLLCETPQKNVLCLPKQGKADDVLLSHLQKISEAANSSGPDCNLKKNLAFLNALLHVEKQDLDGSYKLSAQKIKHYIQDNLHRNLTLTHIAEHFGYTKQYVLRIFKNSFFTTPTKFITEQRLKLSLTYLAETSMKIYEIAEKCGLEDANYFSRVFRMYYRKSPHAYRKEIIASHSKQQK